MAIAKRWAEAVADKATMDQRISDNPKNYPNGSVCTALDTGIVYVAIDGVWNVVGTNT